MDFKHISLDLKGKVARLVLRRAPVNVLNIEMMKEMNHALAHVQETPGLRALVISAEGNSSRPAWMCRNIPRTRSRK